MIVETIREAYASFVLWVFLWAAIRMDLPAWSIYAPGDEDDPPVKGWALADTDETLQALLTGKTWGDDDDPSHSYAGQSGE